jgi:uncharacterized membrane protein YhiD involved in acid resistance
MIEELLINNNLQNISFYDFLSNLLVAVILGFILSRFYIKYSNVISNRRSISNQLVLLAVITSLVISIVKSSLALSLGLVGALSIVRFRTAIKEPEELIYLFIAIAIGLGTGAGQKEMVIIAFIIILIIIYLMNKSYLKGEENPNLYITIINKKPEKIKLKAIVDCLKENTNNLIIKRYDESKDDFEVLFLADFSNFNQFDDAKNELKKIDNDLIINILDNKYIN